MPIFMDRHIVPGIEAQNAAEAHREDLRVQDKFGCRCMTYWVDEERGSAFCLVDGPDEESVRKMHDMAHGLIPHEIIQVNSNVVEAFLGRIHDPEGYYGIDPEFNVSDFCSQMMMSKSKVFRKSTELTGMSPNNLLREYRLLRSLDLLKTNRNIFQTAFESGSTSPSYFTKCFQKRFNLQPLFYQKKLV